MIPSDPFTTTSTTTPFPSEPGTEPDPSPGEEPGGPEEAPGTPEETPFTEPKQYPIHPDIPVQPIHENDPTRC